MSSGSNVLYGLSDFFKLDVCAFNKKSHIVHTNVLKTDVAYTLVNFTALTPYFTYAAGELYYKDRARFIEIKNEEAIESSLVQDGDTTEISTSEDDILELFQAITFSINI